MVVFIGKVIKGTLTDSNFTGNSAITRGAGVRWDGSNGILSNSIFIENNCDEHGGGVSWNGYTGILNNSTFIGNNATHGAGAHIAGNCANFTIIGSTFISNTASDSAGIAWDGANGTLINSTLINNAATSYGGGVSFVIGGVNGIVRGCTFIGNTAEFGGAVYWTSVNSTMFDCNFTNNHAVHGNNVYWIWTADDFLKNTIKFMIMIMFIF